MKNYLKMTREGFTLVELMIVVAIIGVLASIAVPQYAKFQAKSRQSEVRIQLGAAYTVEQSFAAENSTYSACLGQVGYNRDGTKFYYTVGFPAGAAAATKCAPDGNNATGACNVYQWVYCDGVSTANGCTASGTPGYIANNQSVCTSGSITTLSDFFPANITEPAGTNNTTLTQVKVQTAIPTTNGGLQLQQSGFTIGATGYILKNNSTLTTNGAPAGTDAWTIDQNKQILNVQSGLQ